MRIRRIVTIDNHGVAVVEMALVLPLLVSLLLGILCYGQYFLIAHSVQQIANDAARASIAGLDSGERAMLAAQAADDAADANPEVDRSAMVVAVAEHDQAVTVRVSFDASGRLMRFPLVPMPPSLIERSAAVLIGSGA